MMKYFLLILSMLSGQWIIGQSENLIFINGLDVNENRYPDIKGSPYLFEEDWFPADLLTKELNRIPNMPARYNTYTGEFEVRQGDKFIRLVEDRFMRIEFEVDENGNKLDNGGEKFIFQSGFHPRFHNRFVNVVFSGKTMVLFREYQTSVSEKTVQDVGQTVKFKRFLPKVEYYLLQNGELKTLRVNKKTLIKLLGHKKELENFIKDHKLDLDSGADLKKLFTFAETLG